MTELGLAPISRARTAQERLTSARIAVLVPCRDEALTVEEVIRGFRDALPTATIYVYDNCSTDDTAAVATAAGAVVRTERRPGKGIVVRRMFADIDADIYVLVDGDATYDPGVAPQLVRELIDEGLDMVVGTRESDAETTAAYRRGHVIGNEFFNRMIRFVFGGQFTDVLSGYRVMSRRFVKSFPIASEGFDIETEISAHAIDIGAPCSERPTRYVERPEGSESKLRTYSDGFRLLRRGILLAKELRPGAFFTTLFVLLTLVALVLGIPVIDEYVRTGLVPRLPTAILAASIEVIAVLCLAAGIILDSVRRGRLEVKRLAYLSHPAPHAVAEQADEPLHRS